MQLHLRLSRELAAELGAEYWVSDWTRRNANFFRAIKTERTAASMPEPRTGHNIHNVEVVSQQGEQLTVRFNWHTLSYRYQTVDSYFGTTHCTPCARLSAYTSSV